MFGYVAPAFDVLSDEDKTLFRTFYCSLCRQIGKHSQPARLSLSFDMTFLALLLSSIATEPPKRVGCRKCALHPKKAPADVFECEALAYVADLSVILVKAKLDDDVKDEKSLKAKIGNFIIKDIDGRADEKHAVSVSLNELGTIEAAHEQNPDSAADCFARLCADIFSFHSLNDNEKRTLYWLGYNIGRWIYLADAVNDLERDIKNKCYNPYADGRTYSEIMAERRSSIEESLCYTLSQVSAAFDLLNVQRYKSLLENIICIGLPAKLKAVLYGNGKENDESI